MLRAAQGRSAAFEGPTPRMLVLTVKTVLPRLAALGHSSSTMTGGRLGSFATVAYFLMCISRHPT